MTSATELSAALAEHPHGRVPRALRERQVLALAEELFAEQGYSGTSMDELARRMGVSKPVIYGLVGSKEELFSRCVERLSENLAGAIATAAASADDPAHQLRAGVGAFFHFVGAHRRLWEALAWEVSPFAADAARVRRRQTDLVASLLDANARRLGAHVAPVQTEATAHFLNGAMESLARWWGAHEEVGADELSDWAVALVVPGLERIIEAHSGPAAGSPAEG